jgi:hypothetical protein
VSVQIEGWIVPAARPDWLHTLITEHGGSFGPATVVDYLGSAVGKRVKEWMAFAGFKPGSDAVDSALIGICSIYTPVASSPRM